jgi:tetratricopeptide (TPR) repeat protein
MKKIIFIIILISLQWPTVFADNNTVQFANANTAYQKGHYKEALTLYKSLFDKGLESSVLYYNLGNAYFKTNDISSAILFYEKAKKLDPANEEIEFNLKVCNQRIIDKTESLPQLFYERWWKGITGLFSVDGWAKVIIIFLVFTLFSFGLYFASRSLLLRKIGFYAGILFFIISLFGFIFAKQQYSKLQNQKEAIVFSPSVTIKSSPDEKGQDLFIIHEGTKLQLIDNIGEWTEIRLANGSVGWMHSSMLEII